MSDLAEVMEIMNKCYAGIPFTDNDRETIARVLDSSPVMQAEKREQLQGIFKAPGGA